MEVLLPAAQHDGLPAAFGPIPFVLGDGRLSWPPHLHTYGGDLFYCYYSSHPFFGRVAAPHSSPLPRAPSSSDTSPGLDEGDDSPAALARLALQYREAAGRNHPCLSHLADNTDEAAALRRENGRLRFTNDDFVRRIILVGGKRSSAIALADEFRRLTLAEEQAKAMPPAPCPPFVVRSVPAAAEMPKSISVRSTLYLKMKQSGKHRVSKTTNAGSVRSFAQSTCDSVRFFIIPSTTLACSSVVLKQQRMFVGMDGGVKEEEEKGSKEQGAGGLEFEVYTQGMFKTELCNKWEGTGACPHGDLCQFAHDIAELRPVIRHPRYKTEVCCTVLAGVLCPYGHRCHFRHSMTPADGHLLRL